MELITKNKIDNTSIFDTKCSNQEKINFNSKPHNSDISMRFMPWQDIQDEFVIMASHEMKTPIQSILTYSELLHSRKDGVSEEYVQAIYRNALRLQKLSNNLLDITRIENDIFSLKIERFDINKIILDTVQEFVTQIQNSGTKTKNSTLFHSTEGSLYVWADKDRISQVILNLIDNACKFTQNGKITISTKLEDGMIVTSVKDNGSGISPQTFPSLFSKFSTSSHSGTGLGLYLSKAIVDKHGGRIWARNNIEGGSTFVFEIPSTPSHQSAAPTKDTVYF